MNSIKYKKLQLSTVSKLNYFKYCNFKLISDVEFFFILDKVKVSEAFLKLI